MPPYHFPREILNISRVITIGEHCTCLVKVLFRILALPKPTLKKILTEFNERSFNDIPAFKDTKVNTSTENIAKLIADNLIPKIPKGQARLVKVTVWETPDASASYYL